MGFLIRRSAKLLHTFFLNFDLDFYDLSFKDLV